MKWFAPVIGLIAALVLAVPALAAGNTVTHTSFHGIDEEESAFFTEECGFPVTVRLDLRETDIEFAKGGFTAIVNLEGYFYTEDGLQLINDANYRFHVNAAEDEFTFTGVLDRFIDADTGRVLVKDTGFVLFTPDNVITHGPHPTLEEPGFDLCAALT